MNRKHAYIADRIGNVSGKARSYIVDTVKMSSDKKRFEQRGSGPNFQGDLLTLCTCKHQMRSRMSVDQWEDNVWIAGFTGRTIHNGTHWLFFLAKVKSAHDSHTDLWNSIPDETLNAKAAHTHYFGDIFKPKTPIPTNHARFTPSRYVTPKTHAHRTTSDPDGWHRDINYRHPVSNDFAPLLVADPELTFLWDEPLICFDPGKHCRDYHTWNSVQDLIKKLGKAKS
ncbi:MAG TPA: hypothetical protein PLR25_00385 [Planctomycetaceae bacterium]|nr:hypothetical protein [Planctomycetaceae bacterium]